MLCACLFFILIILLNRRTNTESSANDDSDYEVDRAMRSHDNSKSSNDQIPFLWTVINTLQTSSGHKILFCLSDV